MASAKGKKVADAYVELRASDSKLGGDVKVSATKAAREFGGALNRRLQTLDIAPIDVKADPKTALASIDAARARLEQMRGEADSVEMVVRTQRAIAQLDRFRKQLGAIEAKPVTVDADPSPAQREVEKLQRRISALGVDPPVTIDADPQQALAAISRVDAQLTYMARNAATVQLRMDAQAARNDLGRLRKQMEDVGVKGGEGFAAAFLGRLGPLMARMPLSPPMLIAVSAAATAAAPVLGAAIAGAVVGGAAAGGIIGGLKVAAAHPAVQDSAQQTGDLFARTMERAAVAFVPASLDALGQVRGSIRNIEDDAERAFRRAAIYLRPLTEGFLEGGEDAVEGFATAVERAGPIIAVFAEIGRRAGDLVGDSLDMLSSKSFEASRALAALWVVFEYGVRSVVATISVLAEAYGWMEKVGLLLTGQFHKVGQLAAQEEAAKKSKDGLSDSTRKLIKELIGGGDATGQMQTAMKDLQTELSLTAAQMAAMGDIGQQNMRRILLSAGLVTEAMVTQKGKADLLRAAYDQMYGAAIAQSEATEAYKAAEDRLTESIGRNGRTLDINTEAGRANRDALQARLAASNEMYYADIEAGVAIDEARRKHEARTAALEKEAGRIGLNKTETEKLIGVYGKIPPKKTTQILIDGFERIVNQLEELYLFQRSLATGLEMKIVRNRYQGWNSHIGLAEGGMVPGHSPTPKADNIPAMLTAREYVQPVPAVDYYGVAAMEAIRNRQIPREVLQGYAEGGLVGDWGARMPYRTTVRGTRIPSREEVASKVVPEFGAWPSSPAAQRGDSGVWKRILMMVRNSGIPYSFGNAYRHGDPLWHGSGRAIDFMGYNQDRLAQFFMNMQPRVLELIHRTDRRDYAITRGRRVNMPTQLPLHRNHLHIAMDEGGHLMPGWNPPIYNGTGRPEPVIPGSTVDELAELLRALLATVRGDLIDAVEGDGDRLRRALRGPGPTLSTMARL